MLNDSYRHVILRQAIVWIQTGVEIHNPLNSADIISLKKSHKISRIQKWYILYMDFNISIRLTHFLLLVNRVLVPLNFMERSVTWYCQPNLYKFELPGIWHLFDSVRRIQPLISIILSNQISFTKTEISTISVFEWNLLPLLCSVF